MHFNLFSIFKTALTLGLTSFGGPVAHIGYFRDAYVRRLAWLDEAEFASTLALCQFLPGPSSSQLGMAIGYKRGGYAGAILAWLGFTLPSMLLMTAAGVLFSTGARVDTPAVWTAAIEGLGLAAMVVVAQAVWQMQKQLAPDMPRRFVALAAALLCLAMPGWGGQVAALVLAGTLGAIFLTGSLYTGNDSPVAPERGGMRASVAMLCAYCALFVLLPLCGGYAQVLYNAGATVFGGGHVVLPALQTGFARGMSPEVFIGGYGLAQTVPGPLFSFAAFLGAVTAPAAGIVPQVAYAACATVMIFLPGALLLFGVWPFWAQVRGMKKVVAAVTAINAAVVGILAAAVAGMGITHAAEPRSLIAVGAGVVLIEMWKIPAWVTVPVFAGIAALRVLV